MNYYDIVIIGTGMSGLYSAYKIKQMQNGQNSFVLLEKYKKNWIGGRTSNDMFYGSEIVTGAGVGRKHKDKMLYALIRKFGLPTSDFEVNPSISYPFALNIKKIVAFLKNEYKKRKGKPFPEGLTFREFALPILGEIGYRDFIISSGYSDYENEDAFETMNYYGIEDNACCWTGFRVPWKKLVMRLYEEIGEEHFKFSNKVDAIKSVQNGYEIHTEKGIIYTCKKVIVASTIDTVRKLLPLPIYNDIEGQTFLRLYAKFSKASIPILKERIHGTTFVQGPLQKITPINADTGVYMLAYNDNANALALKDNLHNTKENRELYEMLLEKTLNLPENSVHIIAIKDYYWKIGTHYYKPLNQKMYESREQFIRQAQRPEPGIIVVGEAVSRNHGWTEGALQSVEAALTKKWLEK